MNTIELSGTDQGPSKLTLGDYLAAQNGLFAALKLEGGMTVAAREAANRLEALKAANPELHDQAMEQRRIAIFGQPEIQETV